MKPNFYSNSNMTGNEVNTNSNVDVLPHGMFSLSPQQEEYFRGSKVRDRDGNLLDMYHGTNSDFTEFRRDKIGSTGRFEGSGFNFTPYEDRASSYGKNVLHGYPDGIQCAFDIVSTSAGKLTLQAYYEDTNDYKKKKSALPGLNQMPQQTSKTTGRQTSNTNNNTRSAGFNFMPYEGRASSYGKNVLHGYLDIRNPLSADRKTISVSELARIIREADPK